MFVPVPTQVLAKLWPHQGKALRFAVRHLATSGGPCLIRMPTGTGKTGVVACLSRLANQGSTLVVTPWAHLRDQMRSDIDRAFWQTIGYMPVARPVVDLLPSSATRDLAQPSPRVFVTTFATLNDLRLNRPGDYDKLAKAVSLAIVDEGHYEPAVEWGKSIKGLEVPTVLLTATPYRNDLKLFRITDPSASVLHYTHHDAVKDGVIRELAFDTLASSYDIASLAQSFAATWKELRSTKALPSPQPRAIVCCASAADIETAVKHLRASGLNAFGMHEQFDPPSTFLQNKVPDARTTQFEIWVHQHKLTEGLDDHRFCAVALFAPIRNDRKLIQQIGRILRRSSGDRPKPAILLAPPDYSVEQEWSAYREFETKFTLLAPQHFRDVVSGLLSHQPAVEYFDGKFRRRFDPLRPSVQSGIVVPPSVLVHVTSTTFSLDDYVQDCTDTLNTQDAVILGPDINGPWVRSNDHALWVYASIRNSRLLSAAALYEIRLETHCVVVTHDFALVADSAGNYPDEYLDRHTSAAAPSTIARFLDRTFRPTHFSVNNAIPYDTVPRGTEVRGHNLLDVASSLTDRIQICRSARGTSRKHGRRYVGLGTHRLRSELAERARRTFDLSAFRSWAIDVGRILSSKAKPSALFDRFMRTCAPPAQPLPKHICIDLLSPDITIALSDGRRCELTTSGAPIDAVATPSGTSYYCTFRFEGEKGTTASVTLRIEYQVGRQRFWFHKQAGDPVHVMSDDGNKALEKGLAEFLNQKQDVVLIGLDGGQVVYQGRHFYEVDYEQAERELIGLITKPATGLTYSSEKGSKAQLKALRRSKGVRFPQGSVFRAIAELDSVRPFTPTVLVCDDLSSESADFVAANISSQKFALLHAKTGSGTRISASAFHDVVAQAMKNLVYLARNNETPKGVASWKHDSYWNRTAIPRLLLAPRNSVTGQQLFKQMKSVVESTNPDLFVVLVTAGCCDPDALRDAVKDRTKRTAETAQLLYLLNGLKAYAGQLGVSMHVYDLPYQA